jgi:D-alanyl-D-alanine carboxypeptidase
MLRAGARIRTGFRCGALGVAALVAAMAITGNADARTRRHHRHHHRVAAAEPYNPPYASIIVDANSGAVMEEANADSPRHPASLTKVMTLYLLFERLEAGKITLASEMPVSEHASVQAPSKLDLKPGQSISVGTAIRAIVTKSANDVAVVVAEYIGGSEENFAKMMTAKAHALGMMHTNYHNASGLPDDKQITTARDQATLARAMQDRFPEYYRYFATRTFDYHGHEMRNHNHLLGRIPGVDGMKTGYIHDSGFNIIVSMRRNNRHLIAVMFGGRTARARDQRVVDLLDNYINVAAVKHTAPPVVEGWELAAAHSTHVKELKHATEDTAAAGATAPLKPHPVKTFIVHAGMMHTASLSAEQSRSLRPMPAAEHGTVTTLTSVKRVHPDALGVLATKVAAVNDNVRLPPPEPESIAKAHSGWMIQIGAYDSASEAKRRLNAAQHAAKRQLRRADGFTEPVTKGDKTFYRARFAGLEKNQAEAACRHLKHSDIPCMMLKD